MPFYNYNKVGYAIPFQHNPINLQRVQYSTNDISKTHNVILITASSYLGNVSKKKKFH